MKLQEQYLYMEAEAAVDKAEALADALEDKLIDVVALPQYQKQIKRALDLVYTMMDVIDEVSSKIESLASLEVKKNQ